MLTLRLRNGARARLVEGVWQVDGRSANADALRRDWLKATRTERQIVPPSVNVTADEGARRGFWTVLDREPDESNGEVY